MNNGILITFHVATAQSSQKCTSSAEVQEVWQVPYGFANHPRLKLTFEPSLDHLITTSSIYTQ